MSTYIKFNKINDAINTELKLDSTNSLENIHVNDTLSKVTSGIRGSKNSIDTLNAGLIY